MSSQKPKVDHKLKSQKPRVGASVSQRPEPRHQSVSPSAGSAPQVYEDSANHSLIDLPKEIQVRILTYLRANCLAKLQQTCSWFNSPELVHSIVAHAAVYVYPPEMTQGFEKQPVGNAQVVADKKSSSKLVSKSVQSKTEVEVSRSGFYTFEHLRNMELLVIARVLSSPEPAVGFVVSKSWCKAALKWLEVQQEESLNRCMHAVNGKKKGKGTKKNQRMKHRQMNESPMPSPNVNSDIMCPHEQLQHLSSSKSARARRRILDKKAWKILKALYPESTPLESVVGECVQCRAEAEMMRKSQADQKESEKMHRQLPLSDLEIRRFYSRNRGVPEQCLRTSTSQKLVSSEACLESNDNLQRLFNLDYDDERKLPAIVIPAASSSDDECVDCDRITSSCPLVEGLYYALPRSWCHGWRRYMKTGEVGHHVTSHSPHKNYSNSNKITCAFPPPDAAVLLCDAHRMALLPPHLESYLYDEIPTINGVLGSEQKQLLRSSGNSGDGFDGSSRASTSLVASMSSPLVIGQGPTEESLDAMRAAGLSDAEVNRQLSAMRTLEQQRHRAAELETESVISPASRRMRSGSISNSELLDRENHLVVEILTKDEFRALERWWPGTTLFGLRFTVTDISDRNTRTHRPVTSSVQFSTPLCRECDATGRQCSVVIKNRARNWLKKSSEKARAPASLEY